jgi:hypothetical protein
LLALVAVLGALIAVLLATRGGGGSRAVGADDAGTRTAVAEPDLTGGAAQRGRAPAEERPSLDDGIEVRPGVRLGGPGLLEGRVVERASAVGIAGARVELLTLPPTGIDILARIYQSAKFAPNWQKKLLPVATARSGPDGSFAFRGVRNGTYFLEARGARSTPDQAVLVRVDSDGAGGPVDVFVRPGGRVLGRVIDPAGAPARGAEVVVFAGMTTFLTAARNGDFRMFSARTDAEGAFAVPGVPPGAGYFGCASGAGLAVTLHGPFAVDAGADTTIEIQGNVGATVRGRVLARRVAEDGTETVEPVAGAHVGALPRGLRDLAFAKEVLALTHAVTDSEGRYAMHRVPAGEIDVGAAAPGLLPACSPTVVTAEGAESEAEPVVLEGGPRVTLRFKDSAGEPVPGVQTSWFVTDFDELAYEPAFTPLMLQAVEGFEYPTSDADGIAVAGPFPGRPPHTLFCWRSGYEFREVRWNPTTDAAVLDVVMSSGGAAEGIVIDVERAEPVTRFEVRSGRRLDWEEEGPTTINPYSGGYWIEDANGRFRLDALASWDAPVVFSAPGFVPERVKIDVAPGATTRGIIVKLRRGGTVRGRIVDPSGVPIAGAQVAAMDERGRPVVGRTRTPRGSVDSAREMVGQEIAMGSMELFSGLGALGPGFAVSGPDGAYELVALPEERVVIHATHRDFADGRSAPVTVAAGDPREGVDVTLSAGGGIYGTVRDRYGVPVAGALLLALSTDRMANTDPSARWVRQAATDVEGSYRFEHLEAGGYFVACTRGDEALNLASFLGTLNFDLVSVPPDEMVRRDLVDSSAAAVRVYGTVRAEGSAVAGGGIFALGFESENVLGLDVKVAQVRGNGAYEFAGLAPGDYTFSYQGTGPPVRMEVEVPDAPEYRLDLELPGGQLVGIVLDALSGEPIANAETVLLRADVPAAGGLIGTLVQREGNAARDWTSRDGRFAFPRLQGGTYELKVGPPRWGGQGGRWAPIDPIEIEIVDGVKADPLEIRLAPALKLAGVVVDGAGAPLAGARVYAFSHAGGEVRPTTARAGADGAFELLGLAPGRFDVTAAADEHADAAPREVEVGPEPQGELRLVLDRGVEVRVVVRDALGTPIQGATGRLVPLSKTGKAPAPRLDRAIEDIFRGEGVSSTEGVLRLGRFATGRYRLEVGRGSLTAQREPVVLVDGPPLEIEVELQ